MRLLFVCLGNICRSPTAEAVMRRVVREAGLEDRVEIDSAGIGAWHVGEPPDLRAADAARRRGIELTGRGRQVTAADFGRFDLLLAMDRENLRALQRLAPDPEGRAKARLLGDFDAEAPAPGLEVPDPYLGGPDGFEQVLDLVERACRGLLDEVRARTA